MKMFSRWIYAVVIAALFYVRALALNDRPIVGVVVQSSKDTDYEKYGDTFVLSSYVKQIQMAGGRVVPVLTQQSEEYYEQMFSNINGVLFPGGGVDLERSGYAHVGEKFYKMAMQAFDQGDHFPIWGTCNGFELLATIAAGEIVTVPCDAENLTLPLHLASDFKSSRLLGALTDNLAKAVTTEPLTQNNHHNCVSKKTFDDNSSLNSMFRMISTNTDRKGLQFISMLEGLKYPFYAVQFHPEKSQFNWQVTLSVDHSQDAIAFAQYLADFFVQEARKSGHHYPSSDAEGAAMIDNYNSHFLGSPDFHNVYGFNVTTESVLGSDSYPYFGISREMCHRLQLALGTVLVLSSMLFLVLWLKGSFAKRSVRIYRPLSQANQDSNVFVDAGEELPNKNANFM